MQFAALEITTMVGCKVGCGYCPQKPFVTSQLAASPVRTLTLAAFRQCLSTVPTDVHVNFSGYAEPWLNPECTAMVEHAAQKGHTLNIFSTLVGMTADDVDRLSVLPFRRFVVHLADDGTHMHVDVNDDYLATLRRIIGLFESSQGVARGAFLPLELIALGTPHPDVLRLLSGRRVLQRVMHSRAGNVDAALIRSPAARSGALRCGAERLERQTLLPNGDVTLCCMDFGRRHVLGNLLEQAHAELYSGAPYQQVLSRLAGAPGDLLCRTCDHALPA